MFPWGFICVCVFVFQGLLPSDPQREGFGVLAKPETAAYVLQNPNDVILPFWQAVTSHMHTETEMLFRAPLTTASHLSLSPSISLAFFHLHGGLMYAMHDAELLFCLRLRCFEKIFSFLNLWIWENSVITFKWSEIKMGRSSFAHYEIRFRILKKRRILFCSFFPEHFTWIFLIGFQWKLIIFLVFEYFVSPSFLTLWTW